MAGSKSFPEGIMSLLDTDLYKLTMQCCVLKYYKDVEVTYGFTNRTPHMKLSRAAFSWLQEQIDKLATLTISESELAFLQQRCGFFSKPDAGNYLEYLKTFRLRPSDHINASFHPADKASHGENDLGDVYIHITGSWCDTILYEIPLLALVSEAYFKFCDKDWDYEGQVELATQKGETLLINGCIFSEFGTRRRRDYHAQDLVLQGLKKAQEKAAEKGWEGMLSGTSNVHFAHRYDLNPVGTVAHEWFMGVAAITQDYKGASELALRRWVGTFGEGVLGIALTDTFGTPTFLDSFQKPIELDEKRVSYAQSFTGVRQDSGDPLDFVKMMRKFYNDNKIEEKKTIVFSDSLNIDLCLKYKATAEESGFQPTFGIGTFLTNDFVHKSDGSKSVPLNIVIKIAKADGNHAVKISDNIGKNTGDQATVEHVKRELGYEEKDWSGGDESKRWSTGTSA